LDELERCVYAQGHIKLVSEHDGDHLARAFTRVFPRIDILLGHFAGAAKKSGSDAHPEQEATRARSALLGDQAARYTLGSLRSHACSLSAQVSCANADQATGSTICAKSKCFDTMEIARAFKSHGYCRSELQARWHA
ncbi:MAG TPA: hypothetical protein VMF89_06235, partial [Polyangiales bacterium]|nr:hypothetical protein [Polyangiales bacterium]